MEQLELMERKPTAVTVTRVTTETIVNMVSISTENFVQSIET